jgi:hypothetical protein
MRVVLRSSPPMRGKEALPPRRGQHPPPAAWAPVILMVWVASGGRDSYQAGPAGEAGRQWPWGCGARAAALGAAVAVGCA